MRKPVCIVPTSVDYYVALTWLNKIFSKRGMVSCMVSSIISSMVDDYDTVRNVLDLVKMLTCQSYLVSVALAIVA